MFRTRRENRKQKLLQAGLLPFEAHALSELEFKLPYVKKLIKERQGVYTLAKREGWTKKEYTDHIKTLYDNSEWKVKGTATSRTKMVGRADPWAMARHYRQRAIDSGEYTPPVPKKKRKFDRDAIEKGRGRIGHEERWRRRLGKI